MLTSATFYARRDSTCLTFANKIDETARSTQYPTWPIATRFAKVTTFGVNWLVQKVLPAQHNANKIADEYCRGTKLLLDEYLQLRNTGPQTKITVQFNGNDLTLEQVEIHGLPILRYTYQNITVDVEIAMTIDTWAHHIVSELNDTESQIAKLYSNHINTSNRNNYSLEVPWPDLDFNHITLQWDKENFLTATSLANANFTNASLIDVDLQHRNLRNTNFTDANLLDVHLNDANLSYANFTNADLTQANLSNADLSNANLTNANFYRANLAGTKLAGVELSNLQLTPRQLYEADLTGALLHNQIITKESLKAWILVLIKNGMKDLQGMNLSGFDLSNVNLVYANLTNTNLEGANLDGTKLAGVNIDELNLTPHQLCKADLTGALFHNRRLYSQDLQLWILKLIRNGAKDLRGIKLSGFDLSGIDFSNANLSGANLMSADLSNANFTNAILTKTKLYDANLSGAILMGVELKGVKISPKQLHESRWKNALLNGNVLSKELVKLRIAELIAFGFTDLRGINFSNDDLSYTDLSKTGLNEADLSNVNLSNSDLSNASLFNTNLRNAVLTNTNFTDAVLSGAILDGVELSTAQLTPKQLTEANWHNALLYGQLVDEISLKNWILHLIQNGAKDLRGVTLAGVDLSNLDLSGVNLSYANLSNANLSNANLRNATLSSANLDKAILTGAILTKTKLANVELFNLNLTPEQLSTADIRCALISNKLICRTSLQRLILDLVKGGERNLRKVNLSNTDLHQMNFFQANLQESNLSNTNLRKTDLREADLHKANLTSANLCKASMRQTYLIEANLTNASLIDADLNGAILMGATLTNVDIVGADFTGAVLDDVQNFTLNLPDWNAEGSNKLADFFDASDDNPRYCLLTAIYTIDDKYKNLKLSLVHQIIASLKNTQISNPAVKASLLTFLTGNPIYEKDSIIFQFLISDNFDFDIEISNESKLDTSSTLMLTLLLYFTIEVMNGEIKKNIQGLFSICNNGFFVQLLAAGIAHEDHYIKEQTVILYHYYMNLTELSAYKSETYIGMYDESIAGNSEKNLDEIRHIQKDDLAFVFFSSDMQKNTHALIISQDMMDGMLQLDSNHDWGNVYYLQNGERAEVTDVGNVYSFFPLFHRSYQQKLYRSTFTKLLNIIDLNFTNKNNIEHLVAKDYTALFTNALNLHYSDIKLVEDADKFALAEIFNPLMKSETEITDEHYQQISEIYEFSDLEDSVKAQKLICITTQAITFSSSKLFGTEYDSPNALRYYAAGLMTKAYELDKSVFQNKAGEDQFNLWMNKLTGQDGAFTCTSILKNLMIKHSVEKEFDDIMILIKPPAW